MRPLRRPKVTFTLSKFAGAAGLHPGTTPRHIPKNGTQKRMGPSACAKLGLIDIEPQAFKASHHVRLLQMPPTDHNSGKHHTEKLNRKKETRLRTIPKTAAKWLNKLLRSCDNKACYRCSQIVNCILSLQTRISFFCLQVCPSIIY